MTFFDSYVNAAMDETDENNMDALLALAKSSFKRTSKKFTNASKIAFTKAEDDILETLARVGRQNSETKLPEGEPGKLRPENQHFLLVRTQGEHQEQRALQIHQPHL